jgi:CubicO group peptidase (beta-lactamase class C family)
LTEKRKLSLWSGGGVLVCLLLLPAITEMKSPQRYIDFAAFLSIYVGGTVLIAVTMWLWQKYRTSPSPIYPHNVLRASRTMVMAMIVFGVYWFDFSQARPHYFWAEYQYQFQNPKDLSDGWDVLSPEELEIDVDRIERVVERFVNDEQFKWQHSFLLAQDGNLLVDEYFYDESVDRPHDLRSANKSITSILIGIAIDQRIIGGVDDPVSDYFPEFGAAFQKTPKKSRFTIEHLLTMRSGLDANDWDRSSPGNENLLYREKDDWIRILFELPLINSPGSTFAYSTAGEMALRALLVNASGMPLDRFAELHLFAPLGIVNYAWTHRLYGRDDVPIRVELTSRDFAKLGQLFLDGGVWHGKRIVSEEWVSRSTAVHTRTNEANLGNPNYGYLWWRHSFDVDGEEIQGFQAQGAGGQFLFVFPELRAVAVFTSRNYGRHRQINPLRVVRDDLLPVLLEAQGKRSG